MQTQVSFFVDSNGVYLTQCDHDYGAAQGWYEVPNAPKDYRQIWDFNTETWGNAPLTVEDYKVAVQAHMDAQAQVLGYDNITSAISYADEPAVPKFQEEGLAFRAWRSLVWDYCYTQLDRVNAGDRNASAIDELLSELPQF